MKIGAMYSVISDVMRLLILKGLVRAHDTLKDNREQGKVKILVY
jgi:hypothetical protein